MATNPNPLDRFETVSGSAAEVLRMPYASGALRCEWVRSFEHLEEFGSQWDRIWDEDTSLTIYQKRSWMRAFWRAYGNELEMFSLVALRGDELVSILPLVLESGSLQFLGTPESDYNDLICSQEDAETVLPILVRELLKSPMPWKGARLLNVACTSRLNRALQQLPPDLKLHVQTDLHTLCPTILLDKDREETIRRLLQKDSLKRHENRLKKLGNLTFRHIENRAEIREHLEELFEQHTHRHTIAGHFSQFKLQRSRVFYYALVDELDPASDLRFSVVELNGQVVAYHLGFESKGSFIWYKPTFDVDLWEYSPGEVLLRNLLRYAQKPEIREFDFTVGNEGFKGRFANVKKENLGVYLERELGPLQGRAMHLFRSLRDRLRRDERVAEPIRVLKSRFRRMREYAQETTWSDVKHGASRWFRQNVAEEVLLFRNPNSSFAEKAIASHKFEIRRVRLRELARLANELPGFLSPAYLQSARERLKLGDRPYVARDSRTAQVFWCGAAARMHPLPAEVQRLLPPRAAAVDFVSSAAISPDTMGAALAAVAKIETEQGKNVCSFINSSDRAGARALLTAGFRREMRIRRIAVLGKCWTRPEKDKSLRLAA